MTTILVTYMTRDPFVPIVHYFVIDINTQRR